MDIPVAMQGLLDLRKQKSARWFKSWPFYPRSLELSNKLWRVIGILHRKVFFEFEMRVVEGWLSTVNRGWFVVCLLPMFVFYMDRVNLFHANWYIFQPNTIWVGKAEIFVVGFACIKDIQPIYLHLQIITWKKGVTSAWHDTKTCFFFCCFSVSVHLQHFSVRWVY